MTDEHQQPMTEAVAFVGFGWLNDLEHEWAPSNGLRISCMHVSGGAGCKWSDRVALRQAQIGGPSAHIVDLKTGYDFSRPPNNHAHTSAGGSGADAVRDQRATSLAVGFGEIHAVAPALVTAEDAEAIETGRRARGDAECRCPFEGGTHYREFGGANGPVDVNPFHGR